MLSIKTDYSDYFDRTFQMVRDDKCNNGCREAVWPSKDAFDGYKSPQGLSRASSRRRNTDRPRNGQFHLGAFRADIPPFGWSRPKQSCLASRLFGRRCDHLDRLVWGDFGISAFSSAVRVNPGKRQSTTPEFLRDSGFFLPRYVQFTMWVASDGDLLPIVSFAAKKFPGDYCRKFMFRFNEKKYRKKI